ncbi:MAG: hypothetical protein ABEJ24_02780 [Candidatus Magasanikbacteria bacterium]
MDTRLTRLFVIALTLVVSVNLFFYPASSHAGQKKDSTCDPCPSETGGAFLGLYGPVTTDGFYVGWGGLDIPTPMSRMQISGFAFSTSGWGAVMAGPKLYLLDRQKMSLSVNFSTGMEWFAGEKSPRQLGGVNFKSPWLEVGGFIDGDLFPGGAGLGYNWRVMSPSAQIGADWLQGQLGVQIEKIYGLGPRFNLTLPHLQLQVRWTPWDPRFPERKDWGEVIVGATIF